MPIYLTRLLIMPCLSLRRALATWKTSAVCSVLALSIRFHRPQNTPDWHEPSLRKSRVF